MTTSQLAQRLAQKVFGRDWSRLTLTTSEEIRAAINKGLEQFGTLLPMDRRTRPVGLVLERPVACELTVTEGSEEVTLVTPRPIALLTDADIPGKTVVIDGQPCRFLSISRLAEPWLGTTGSRGVMIFSDAASLAVNTSQLVGDPTWAAYGSTRAETLFYGKPLGEHMLETTPHSVGTPRHYWIDYLQGVQSAGVVKALRVWPAPSVRGRLGCMMLQIPQSVTLEDLYVTPREIPTDAMEEGYLQDLVTQHLLNADGVRDGFDKTQAATDARFAVSRLMERMNANASGKPNRVGTPRNF